MMLSLQCVGPCVTDADCRQCAKSCIGFLSKVSSKVQPTCNHAPNPSYIPLSCSHCRVLPRFVLCCSFAVLTAYHLVFLTNACSLQMCLRFCDCCPLVPFFDFLVEILPCDSFPLLVLVALCPLLPPSRFRLRSNLLSRFATGHDRYTESS